MKKIILLFFIFLTTYSFLCLSTDITAISDQTIDLNSSFTLTDNIILDKIDSYELNIYSKRAIIYERNSNTILYGKNINEVCPMASTTKIMTALLVIESSNLESIVTISKKAASTGGSRLGLKENDTIKVIDLLYGLMLPSGNDAAYALAEYVGGTYDNFISMMNNKAKSLGLVNTNFESPHGLDSTNHHTTILELAKITDYALNNDVFRKIVNTKKYTVYINNSPKTISNTNELLGTQYVYGVKTGFTNKAGRCLVSVANNNDLDIIIIVLGADSKKIRTSDSKKLLKYAFDNYTLIDLLPFINLEFNNIKDNKLKNLNIKKSFKKLNNIYIPINKHIYFPILKNGNNMISTTSNNINNIESPILKNDIIYSINVYINGKFILSSKVLSSENVYRTNYIEYLYYFIKNFKNIVNNIQF